MSGSRRPKWDSLGREGVREPNVSIRVETAAVSPAPHPSPNVTPRRSRPAAATRAANPKTVTAVKAIDQA